MEPVKSINETFLLVQGLVAHVISQMGRNSNIPEPMIELYCEKQSASMAKALNDAFQAVSREHEIPGTEQNMLAVNLFLLYVCGQCLDKMLSEPNSVAHAALTVMMNEPL